MWNQPELARNQIGLHATSPSMELQGFRSELDQRYNSFRNQALLGAFQLHRQLTWMSRARPRSEFGLEHLVRNAWAFSWEEETREVSQPKTLSDFLKVIRKIQEIDYGLTQGPSIKQLKGNIREVSKDFRGNKYLCFLLKQGPNEDVNIIFEEMIEHCEELATHQYAHYIIRDMFQRVSEDKQIILLARMNVVKAIVHPVGNHVIQRAIVVLGAPLKAQLVSYLRGSVVELFKNTYASFALEKILDNVDTGTYWFFVDEILGKVIHLALNKTSTRIIQRMIANLPDLVARPILDELHFHMGVLKTHSMGGWVIQAMIKRSKEDASKIIDVLMEDFPFMSILETPSYTVRLALQNAPLDKRGEMIRHISSDKNFRLINDNQFGQHVVSSMIQLATLNQREEIFSKIRTPPFMYPQ